MFSMGLNSIAKHRPNRTTESASIIDSDSFYLAVAIADHRSARYRNMLRVSLNREMGRSNKLFVQLWFWQRSVYIDVRFTA